MTYIELCRQVRELAGITGTGPASTVGQSGELLRVVNWVKSSWVDIQNIHTSWNFLLEDLSFTTVAAQGDYTPAQMGASNLRKLDVESMRCHTQPDLSDQQYLYSNDWAAFRDVYRYNRQTSGRPIQFAVEPRTKSVCLAAIPDGAYTVTGRYWSKPVELAADGDAPAMPSEFHMLIVYWALSKYAGYEAAPEVKQEAESNRARILASLEADQLPGICLEGAFL